MRTEHPVLSPDIVRAIVKRRAASRPTAESRRGHGGAAGARLAAWFLLPLVFSALHMAPLAAQATPYVPTLDPAYRDLDALVSAGLVRDVMAGERPYSRSGFARFVAEAEERTESGPERAPTASARGGVRAP